MPTPISSQTPMSLRFKSLFEEQKKSLTFSAKGIMDDSFHLNYDDLADESDHTSSAMEQSMRLRLRNREALYLKKIEEALLRIQEGTFGTCESCEEEIEPKRLEARPTTTYCLACKEDSERTENVHMDSRKPKSMGRAIKLA